MYPKGQFAMALNGATGKHEKKKIQATERAQGRYAEGNIVRKPK